MNSWDEDPDERLRWQRMFADFEVQPRSSLSRRILGQLPTGRRRKPTRWLAGAGLLLLLSTGLIYLVRPDERPESGRGNAKAVRRSTPVQPRSAGRVRPTMDPTTRLVPGGLPITDPLADEPVPNVADVRVDAPSGGISDRRPAPIGHLPAGQTKLRRGATTRLRTIPVFTNQSPSKSARSVRPRFPVESSGPVATVGNEPIAAPVERSVIQSPVKATSIVWTRLKPLGIMPLAHSLSTLSGQLAVVVATVHPVQAAVARSRPRWFIEAVPQSSFQRMSAPPALTAYLSPVSAPRAFSPATWGYQINGGIRFRRWQASLSVGQLRRWAYYTVNENRYRVAPSPTDPHQLVRETQGVAENVALPMMGAGLSQQTLLAQGRYVIELGGQVSYLLTSDQALMSLRGGIGRRLPLSRRTELQAGLTVGYGLNQLLNERQHLVIHPLLVGIGLRIQPRPTR